jgi:hypothetical protein
MFVFIPYNKRLTHLSKTPDTRVGVSRLRPPSPITVTARASRPSPSHRTTPDRPPPWCRRCDAAPLITDRLWPLAAHRCCRRCCAAAAAAAANLVDCFALLLPPPPPPPVIWLIVALVFGPRQVFEYFEWTQNTRAGRPEVLEYFRRRPRLGY